MNTRRRSPLEEKLSWLLTTMDAWLFTTIKYLSGFAKGPFPAGLRVDRGGWAREKKNLDENSEGAACEEERPETASRSSGTHSTAETTRAFQLAARGAQIAGALPRASRGGRAWNGLCSSSSCGSKPSGQIPPQAPPVQSSGSKGDASPEKQGEGRGNPSLWGLSTGV